MEISKRALAGSLESNDVLIEVYPSDDLVIELYSIVITQFEEHLLKLINNVITCEKIKNGTFVIKDKGALDYTLIARLKTVIKRGIGNE